MNAIVKTDRTSALANLIHQFAPQIKMALPKHLSADRMTRIIITEVRKNPKLAECTQASFFGAVIQCAQLGLEPGSGLGHAYLVPYGNEVTFITGYQGMIELAERNGLSVFGRVVYAGDHFEYEYGLNERCVHRPSPIQGNRGEVVAAYAVAVYKDGRKKFEVVEMADIEKARASSKSRSGPWVTHFAEMAKKTAVRRLFKVLPKSPEMARVQELEDSIEVNGQDLASAYSEFRDENKLPDILPKEAVSIKQTVAFSSKNPEQLKEVNEIMKNMKVASDTQQMILDELEGKDIEADLMRLIKEHS